MFYIAAKAAKAEALLHPPQVWKMLLIIVNKA